MTINEFLFWEQTTRDTIDLKKIYVDVAGDLASGVLLSQIMYWNLPSKEGQTRLRVYYDDKLWLAKGREDWWEECRITPKQFDRAIKVLEDKDIVETTLKKFNGTPTKHIHLKLESLMQNIEKILKEAEGKMDIDQRVKSELTIDTNGFSPLGKMDFNHSYKSLTETTPKKTTKTINNTFVQKDKDKFNNFNQRAYDGSDGGLTIGDIENKLLGWEQ